MAETDELVVLVSNTGPLISAFQSDSFDLMVGLLGVVHTTHTCLAELIRHGWQTEVERAGSSLVAHLLTGAEQAQADVFARQIAAHPISKDREPGDHLGEAEAIALAMSGEFPEVVLLLDEIAARAVATEAGMVISGFAGVLLLAVEQNLITADELKARLEKCRLQGTHYGVTFIDQVYLAAKERSR